MRQFYIICAMVLILSCLTACSETAQPESATSAPIESSEPQTECPTVAPTEPTEAPEPTEDLSIGISAGSHLLTYQDEVLQDYLDYYLFIPDNAVKHMPLVIFLHGDSEVGKPEKLENYGLIKKARELYGEEYPFISISPNTREKSWTNGKIPELLKGLIDEIVEEYHIDSNKIIITGHSRGSAGVWHMISQYGDFFSAAVPISSPPQTAMNHDRCILVPCRAFAGNIGEFECWALNETEKKVAILKKLGADCELTVLLSCDHTETIDAALTQEIFDWMLSQERIEPNNETIQ